MQKEKSVISNNKDKNYNSNNDDLKDGQNYRLQNKYIFISIRNWLGLLNA